MKRITPRLGTARVIGRWSAYDLPNFAGMIKQVPYKIKFRNQQSCVHCENHQAAFGRVLVIEKELWTTSAALRRFVRQ